MGRRRSDYKPLDPGEGTGEDPDPEDDEEVVTPPDEGGDGEPDEGDGED